MQLQVSTSTSPALRGNCPFRGVFATAFLPLLALTILGLVKFKPWKCPHRFQRVLTQLSIVLSHVDHGPQGGRTKSQSPWKGIFSSMVTTEPWCRKATVSQVSWSPQQLWTSLPMLTDILPLCSCAGEACCQQVLHLQSPPTKEKKP